MSDESTTIGELLYKLAEAEGFEQRAERLYEQAGDGPFHKGSQADRHFIESSILQQKATAIRTKLYEATEVDRLRAKAAADTGESKLTPAYVRKLAGALAQRESVGLEAVMSLPAESLMGNPERAPKSQADLLAKLESDTPSFDRENGLWVRNKLAASLEGLETGTLKTYRYGGIKNADGTLGSDTDGRVWRRPGTPNSHPWYLRSTLKSEQ